MSDHKLKGTPKGSPRGSPVGSAVGSARGSPVGSARGSPVGSARGSQPTAARNPNGSPSSQNLSIVEAHWGGDQGFRPTSTSPIPPRVPSPRISKNSQEPTTPIPDQEEKRMSIVGPKKMSIIEVPKDIHRSPSNASHQSIFSIAPSTHKNSVVSINKSEVPGRIRKKSTVSDDMSNDSERNHRRSTMKSSIFSGRNHRKSTLKSIVSIDPSIVSGDQTNTSVVTSTGSERKSKSSFGTSSVSSYVSHGGASSETSDSRKRRGSVAASRPQSYVSRQSPIDSETDILERIGGLYSDEVDNANDVHMTLASHKAREASNRTKSIAMARSRSDLENSSKHRKSRIHSKKNDGYLHKHSTPSNEEPLTTNPYPWRSSLNPKAPIRPTRYLQTDMGTYLIQCLRDLCQVQPADPIEYIAHWLYKSVDEELYFYEKIIFNKECSLVVLELQKQQAQKAEIYQQIAQKSKELQDSIHKNYEKKKRLMIQKLQASSIDVTYFNNEIEAIELAQSKLTSSHTRKRRSGMPKNSVMFADESKEEEEDQEDDEQDDEDEIRLTAKQLYTKAITQTDHMDPFKKAQGIMQQVNAEIEQRRKSLAINRKIIAKDLKLADQKMAEYDTDQDTIEEIERKIIHGDSLWHYKQDIVQLTTQYDRAQKMKQKLEIEKSITMALKLRVDNLEDQIAESSKATKEAAYNLSEQEDKLKRLREFSLKHPEYNTVIDKAQADLAGIETTLKSFFKKRKNMQEKKHFLVNYDLKSKLERELQHLEIIESVYDADEKGSQLSSTTYPLSKKSSMQQPEQPQLHMTLPTTMGPSRKTSRMLEIDRTRQGALDQRRYSALSTKEQEAHAELKLKATISVQHAREETAARKAQLKKDIATVQRNIDTNMARLGMITEEDVEKMLTHTDEEKLDRHLVSIDEDIKAKEQELDKKIESIKELEETIEDLKDQEKLEREIEEQARLVREAKRELEDIIISSQYSKDKLNKAMDKVDVLTSQLGTTDKTIEALTKVTKIKEGLMKSKNKRIPSVGEILKEDRQRLARRNTGAVENAEKTVTDVTIENLRAATSLNYLDDIDPNQENVKNKMLKKIARKLHVQRHRKRSMDKSTDDSLGFEHDSSPPLHVSGELEVSDEVEDMQAQKRAMKKHKLPRKSSVRSTKSSRRGRKSDAAFMDSDDDIVQERGIVEEQSSAEEVSGDMYRGGDTDSSNEERVAGQTSYADLLKKQKGRRRKILRKKSHDVHDHDDYQSPSPADLTPTLTRSKERRSSHRLSARSHSDFSINLESDSLSEQYQSGRKKSNRHHFKIGKSHKGQARRKSAGRHVHGEQSDTTDSVTDSTVEVSVIRPSDDDGRAVDNDFERSESDLGRLGVDRSDARRGRRVSATKRGTKKSLRSPGDRSPRRREGEGEDGEMEDIAAEESTSFEHSWPSGKGEEEMELRSESSFLRSPSSDDSSMCVCSWTLEKSYLICHHPILGKLKTRAKVKRLHGADNASSWDTREFDCHVFYHGDLYTQCPQFYTPPSRITRSKSRTSLDFTRRGSIMSKQSVAFGKSWGSRKVSAHSASSSKSRTGKLSHHPSHHVKIHAIPKRNTSMHQTKRL